MPTTIFCILGDYCTCVRARMNLLPQHPDLPPDHWLWRSIHHNMGRAPLWTFPDTLLGSGIRLERLHFDNYDELWPLLAIGDITYVNREYRERQALYEQTIMQRTNSVYSGANGAVDFLVIDTPDKHTEYAEQNDWSYGRHLHLADGESLAGVVHLYELSHERFGQGMRNPFIGIQLAAQFRGRGVADRAIEVLEHFVANNYPEVSGVTAMIKQTNARSLSFFRRRGYKNTDEYGEGDERRAEVFLAKPVGIL